MTSFWKYNYTNR